MRRSLRYAVAPALLLTLVACGSDDDPQPEPSPGDGTSESATSTPSPTPSPSSSDGQPDEQPSGGTAGAPTPLTPTTALLDWRPVEASTDDAVTRNDDWTLSVTDDGAEWELAGPSAGSAGGKSGWRVSDALLDEDWAVVVLQDKAEQRPSQATVTDLETGRSFTIDGRSDVPTTTGGTWALGDDRVLHASVDPDGAYCLASVDLESQTSESQTSDGQTSEIAWCAPERHGFNGASATDAGDSILTFDDAQPACRTVGTVAAGTLTPYAGVPDCKAWEGVAIEDGAVWSIIPRERRVEEAHLYARVGDGFFDLGPGTAGTLVWCDDAAYFARDPQQQGGPAALLRWSPDDGLSVAYESPRGQAFIERPRCGGETLTITALASSRDEQVSADLP